MENTATQPKIESRFYQGEDYTVRMVNEEKRTIEGYGIVFNSESRMLGGWFIERIRPEAVRNAFEKVDLRSEFNHNTNFLLGRVSSGTMRFKVDERGVKYIVDVPRNYYGDGLLESVKRGDVRGSSFQFWVREGGEEWNIEVRDGKNVQVRDITDFEVVSEMGPVTEPAYPDTTVAKRSFEDFQKSKTLEHGPKWELELAKAEEDEIRIRKP